LFGDGIAHVARSIVAIVYDLIPFANADYTVPMSTPLLALLVLGVRK